MNVDDSYETQEGFSEEELSRLAPLCTDSANADRFVGRHGAGFRWVVEWERWISWDGRRWIVVGAAGRVMHAAMLSAREDYALAKLRLDTLRERARVARLADQKDLVEELGAQSKIVLALMKWHGQSQNAGGIASCVRLLATRITVRVPELDACPWHFNIANGTIDLRTADLLPHTREHYITQLVEIEWDDAATCPTWDKFLATVMGGDMTLTLYLARTVGYSLTGLATEQCLFFLYGLGSNGKSTFLNTIKSILGEYACAAPRDLLMVQRAPKHETEIARLLGKRMATGAEVGDGHRFDEAKVKDLTGDEPLSARRMNEDFWDFQPTHKLWLAGNYRPTIIGSDHGIWRRIRLLPWLVTIDAEARDRDLTLKLRRELSGILRWAVGGCLEWQRIGLAEPASVLRATEEYRADSDVLGAFVRDTLVFEPGVSVSRKTLREAYETWCRDAGHEPVSGRRLAQRLRDLGAVDADVRESGVHRKGWLGCRLLTQVELVMRSRPTSDSPVS